MLFKVWTLLIPDYMEKSIKENAPEVWILLPPLTLF